MILRDEQGEVEVGIGDLFKIKDAEFSVICPELTIPASPIWVRLHAGVIESDGRQIKIEEGKAAPVYLFPAAMVARCMREHRLMTFDIPEPVSQHPTQSETKGSRARTRQKDAGKPQPITNSLFE